MHAFLFATTAGPQGIPQALLPIKGRSVIDYLLDDMLDQKDILSITILTTKSLAPLLKKHIQNTYREKQIDISIDRATLGGANEDVLICKGEVYSSLKMQDFIRAFKQYKTAITAEYRQDGKHLSIPHCIIPLTELPHYLPHIGEDGSFIPNSTHTMRIQNIGTGFCYEATSLSHL